MHTVNSNITYKSCYIWFPYSIHFHNCLNTYMSCYTYNFVWGSFVRFLDSKCIHIYIYQNKQYEVEEKRLNPLSVLTSETTWNNSSHWHCLRGQWDMCKTHILCQTPNFLFMTWITTPRNKQLFANCHYFQNSSALVKNTLYFSITSRMHTN